MLAMLMASEVKSDSLLRIPSSTSERVVSSPQNVYFFFRGGMRRFGYSQALFVLAHYLCLLWMARVGGVLFGTVLKVAAVLLLAFLLIFVVGRSAAVVRALSVRLQALASLLSSLVTGSQWTRRPLNEPVYLCEPELSAHFQRPPPLSTV